MIRDLANNNALDSMCYLYLGAGSCSVGRVVCRYAEQHFPLLLYIVVWHLLVKTLEKRWRWHGDKIFPLYVNAIYELRICLVMHETCWEMNPLHYVTQTLGTWYHVMLDNRHVCGTWTSMTLLLGLCLLELLMCRIVLSACHNNRICAT